MLRRRLRFHPAICNTFVSVTSALACLSSTLLPGLSRIPTEKIVVIDEQGQPRPAIGQQSDLLYSDTSEQTTSKYCSVLLRTTVLCTVHTSHCLTPRYTSWASTGFLTVEDIDAIRSSKRSQTRWRPYFTLLILSLLCIAPQLGRSIDWRSAKPRKDLPYTKALIGRRPRQNQQGLTSIGQLVDSLCLRLPLSAPSPVPTSSIQQLVRHPRNLNDCPAKIGLRAKTGRISLSHAYRKPG